MQPPRVTLEDLTPVRKRLQVEIPAEAVAAEIERAFRTVAQQAKLPGFRPGRVPRTVLERTFGPQVRREVLGRLVEESFTRAIEEHRLAVVGTPDVDAETPTPGEALRYSATVEIRPTIVLGDLGDVTVTRPSAAVTEEEVGRVLEGMRESVAQLHPVEGRTVIEAGDVVTVDLTSHLPGAESVRREGVHLDAGRGSFPLALERQLVGQHCGARLSLAVPYPADYGNPGLAGRTAEFEVEVKALHLKELPALDDDFARDHGHADSLEALRGRVRADLEHEASDRADTAVRQAVLERAMTGCTFELPPSLVERRTQALAASVDVRVPEGPERERARGELQARLAPLAQAQVRSELFLDAVAARDGVSVSDAEVAAEVDAIAARERRVPEQVRAFYERPEARAALRARLVRDRALGGLVAAARVMPEAAAGSVAPEK